MNTVASYPLTRNYYENNSLRIIFRNKIRGGFCSQNVQEKKDGFKELRVGFAIFRK